MGMPGFVAQGATHPRWALDIVTKGWPLKFGTVAAAAPKNVPIGEFAHDNFDVSTNWKDIEWIRSIFPGKIILKGILDPEDAKRAVQTNIDGIGRGGLPGVPRSVEIIQQWEKLWPLIDKDHPQSLYGVRAQTLDQDVVEGTSAAVRCRVANLRQLARDIRPKARLLLKKRHGDVPSFHFTVPVTSSACRFDELHRDNRQVAGHCFAHQPFGQDQRAAGMRIHRFAICGLRRQLFEHRIQSTNWA